MSNVDLLPCPCGGTAKIYPTGTEIGPREKLVASCDDPECQWSMTGFGPEQVAERWSRRANVEANTEALRAEVTTLSDRLAKAYAAKDRCNNDAIYERDRAERLAEALLEATDMLLADYPETAKRLRAALHPTAAQENDHA